MITYSIHGYDTPVWRIGQTELADNGLTDNRNQTIKLAFATNGLPVLTLSREADDDVMVGWIDEQGELEVDSDVEADWFRGFEDFDPENLKSSLENLIVQVIARRAR